METPQPPTPLLLLLSYDAYADSAVSEARRHKQTRNSELYRANVASPTIPFLKIGLESFQVTILERGGLTAKRFTCCTTNIQSEAVPTLSSIQLLLEQQQKRPCASNAPEPSATVGAPTPKDCHLRHSQPRRLIHSKRFVSGNVKGFESMLREIDGRDPAFVALGFEDRPCRPG